MAAPRSELAVVRGWRAEFRLWWLMAKHVEITYDKSQNGGSSLSMCLPCCQILSTRACDGTVSESARGCDFHLKRPEIPIAVRSTITSVRLREMLKPHMIVESFFIEKADDDVVSFLNGTDLMDVAWVARIRRNHQKAKRSKKLYVHSENGCIHSSEPDSVVQGLGPRHIYFKRCDGLFFNAFGEKLEIVGPDSNVSRTEKVRCPRTPDLLAPRDPDLEDLQWISSLITRPCQDDVLSCPLTPKLEDEIEESTNRLLSVPEDQTSTGFNDKADPWAAIDDPTSSSRASAPPQELSIDTEFSSGEEGPLTPIHKAIQANLDQGVKGCMEPELVLPQSEKTALPSPTPTNAQPSPSTPATFLMPYEVAAARQLRDAPLPPAPLPVEMDVDATKLAELAWRRLNPYLVLEEEKEEREDQEALKRSKRKWYRFWRR